MNALTKEPLIDEARAAARDHRAGPGDREPVHQGPPGHGDPRGPQVPGRQADPHGRAAPHPRPEGRSADRRTAEHPHPQVARRPGDGPVLAGARRRTASRWPGLYAAGEAAGFGGGGVHGYRSLEGTFLGGCIFSGRAAGRAAAQGGGLSFGPSGVSEDMRPKVACGVRRGGAKCDGSLTCGRISWRLAPRGVRIEG